MFPEGLQRQAYLGSYICPEWELRVTERCLTDDLGQSADASFDDLSGLEIVKAFKKDRYERIEDTRRVNDVGSSKPVWVLSYGHDHRGGTWFDETERVVWLLAYGPHRRGDPNDFFRKCSRIAGEGKLWPSESDYERLFRDRGDRFAWWVRLEAPLILKQAEQDPGNEHRIMFGGRYGACLAVEVADELRETAVAFRVDTVPFDYVPIILAALHPDADWQLVAKMPSRELDPMEIAYSHMREESN